MEELDEDLEKDMQELEDRLNALMEKKLKLE
jgi:hypothetical protein